MSAMLAGAGCAAQPAMALPGRAVDGASAQRMFTALQQCAAQAGVALRPPPPEPTTCCGRGCNGCVWEGFLNAAEYWRQEALLQLGAGGAA